MKKAIVKLEIINSKELSKLLNRCKRKVMGPGIIKISEVTK
jgi:hypothetical protein